MKVHFSPDVQAKLEQMARDAGRQPAAVIEDAVIGLYDELTSMREMLDRCYDEMEDGKVQGIDGEEAYRRLMEKTQAMRSRPACALLLSTRKPLKTSTKSAPTCRDDPDAADRVVAAIFGRIRDLVNLLIARSHHFRDLRIRDFLRSERN